MEELEQLPNLQHLQLALRNVERVPSLKQLKSLRILVTSGGRRVDWSFVRGLGQLHSLCIGDVNTELDLKHISGLAELRELYIDSGAKVPSLNPTRWHISLG